MQVGVVGFGQMGSGIAQVCALAGMHVYAFDTQIDLARRTLENMIGSIKALIDRGKLPTESPDMLRQNLYLIQNIEDFAGCEVIIEAVTEKPNIKKDVLSKVSGLTQDALIGSNTSSISITWLGSHVFRPERFLGIHFMNPVPVMSLVEIVRGIRTDDVAYERALNFVKSLNKQPVTAPDIPGFLVNRMLVPMILEAVRLYELGCDKSDIDRSMKLGANHPMGPLELADFVGLDTLLYLANYIYEQTGEPKYCPPNLLRRYVEAGWLGRKTKRGFYEYS